jgi:hypothetical protein
MNIDVGVGVDVDVDDVQDATDIVAKTERTERKASLVKLNTLFSIKMYTHFHTLSFLFIFIKFSSRHETTFVTQFLSLVSCQGEIKEKSSEKFLLRIVSLTICDDYNDGLFSPGETIVIKDIVVMNCGGLTLPEGAKLFVISSDTIQAFDEFITLPEVRPGEYLQLQQTLRAQIIEMPPPTKGLFVLYRLSLSTHTHTLSHLV